MKLVIGQRAEIDFLMNVIGSTFTPSARVVISTTPEIGFIARKYQNNWIADVTVPHSITAGMYKMRVEVDLQGRLFTPFSQMIQILAPDVPPTIINSADPVPFMPPITQEAVEVVAPPPPVEKAEIIPIQIKPIAPPAVLVETEVATKEIISVPVQQSVEKAAPAPVVEPVLTPVVEAKSPARTPEAKPKKFDRTQSVIFGAAEKAKIAEATAPKKIEVPKDLFKFTQKEIKKVEIDLSLNESLKKTAVGKTTGAVKPVVFEKTGELPVKLIKNGIVQE